MTLKIAVIEMAIGLKEEEELALGIGITLNTVQEAGSLSNKNKSFGKDWR